MLLPVVVPLIAACATPRAGTRPLAIGDRVRVLWTAPASRVEQLARGVVVDTAGGRVLVRTDDGAPYVIAPDDAVHVQRYMGRVEGRERERPAPATRASAVRSVLAVAVLVGAVGALAFAESPAKAGDAIAVIGVSTLMLVGPRLGAGTSDGGGWEDVIIAPARDRAPSPSGAPLPRFAPPEGE